MKKKALVISGGGSKGAFAVGVLKNLIGEYSLDFDIVVGTSTGALIAPMAALGDLITLEDVYTKTTTNQVIKAQDIGEAILEKKSVYNVEPLQGKIESIYTKNFYDQLQASGKEVYIITTCLQSEQIVVYTNNAAPKGGKYYETEVLQGYNHFQRAVLASACQPVFMNPVMVNKNIAGHHAKDLQYVDGGVREYAGVQMAIDAGAEEIFVVLLSTGKPSGSTEPFAKLLSIAGQTLQIFMEDISKNDLIGPFIYNDALQYIYEVKHKMLSDGIPAATVDSYFSNNGGSNPFAGKRPLQIHIIRPNTALNGGMGGLIFNPADMKGMMAFGESSSNVYVASLNKTDVDWLV